MPDLGYAGYYGLSLISGSYAVLFVSLAGHAAQFAFLVLFENPRAFRFFILSFFFFWKMGLAHLRVRYRTLLW